MANPKEKTRKLLCPECETEVELIDGEGKCSACGLDVGWVLENARRKRATETVLRRQDEEVKKTDKGKKTGDGFSFA